MKRKLDIYQYGSELFRTTPTPYSPSDWLEISIDESSPYPIKPEQNIVVFGNTTPSDLDFMHSNNSFSFPTTSSANSIGSTCSDAQSAPPVFSELLKSLSVEYTHLLPKVGRQIPPQWDMPDLVRAVVSNDRLTLDLLKDAYYDVIICGTRSWIFEEVVDYIDLVNYAL